MKIQEHRNVVSPQKENQSDRMKRGQGLPITTIIIAILVLIVLVVLILIFTGKIGEWRTQTEQVGSVERFAGGEQDVEGKCDLDGGSTGTCRTLCKTDEKVGRQSRDARRDNLCKFGLFCCTEASKSTT